MRPSRMVLIFGLLSVSVAGFAVATKAVDESPSVKQPKPGLKPGKRLPHGQHHDQLRQRQLQSRAVAWLRGIGANPIYVLQKSKSHLANQEGLIFLKGAMRK